MAERVRPLIGRDELKEVDAQVTFVSEGAAIAKRMILHQNGRDLSGDRIE